MLAPGTGGDGFASLGGYRLKAGSPCLTGGWRLPKDGGHDFTGAATGTGGTTGIGAIWVAPGTSAAIPLKVTMPETDR